MAGTDTQAADLGPHRPAVLVLATWALSVVEAIAVVALVVAQVTAVPVAPVTTPFTPLPTSVLDAATSVSPATLATEAAMPTLVPTTPLRSTNGPLHTAVVNGRRVPLVTFLGAEYCTACAAERWPLLVALSHFGTFSSLGTATSTGSTTPGFLDSISFSRVHYTSPYLAFTATELYASGVNALGLHPPLNALSAAARNLLLHASPPATIPLVDLGGRAQIVGAQFAPTTLVGMSRQQIADGLGDPSVAATQGIVTAAQAITDQLCVLTGEVPRTTCRPTLEETS